MNTDKAQYKYPIKGVFKENINLFESPFGSAEVGSILIVNNEISIQVGPVFYSIVNIVSISKSRAKKVQIEPSIELVFVDGKEERTLYIFDYKYFGLRGIFSSKGLDKIYEIFKKLIILINNSDSNKVI